jgi:hypothetical protein
MMKPPAYYSEWVRLLDLLKEPGQDDENILSVLEKGTLEWKAGVADKILNCAYEVIETRLKYTTRMFQQEMDRSHGQEAAILAAILNARSRFDRLYRLCRLPVFPDEVKSALVAVVNQYVNDTQEALLESAKHDRTGQLGYIVRHNSLKPQQFVQEASAAREAAERNEPGPAQFTTRRRVLF